MGQRLRVQWLVKGLGLGGAERLLSMHARHADHEAFEYRCWYVVDGKDALVGELEDAGVVTERLDRSCNWSVDLARRLRADPPDVLHAHSPLPATMARLAAAVVPPRRRPALVTTEHNRWAMYRPPTRWANRATFGLDDLHLAVSGNVIDSIPQRHRTGVRVITHGIDREQVRQAIPDRADVRETLGIGQDAVVVTTIANTRPEKALDVLLRAAVQVVARDSRVVFLHAGVGPETEALRSLHTSLDLGDRVRFLGFRDDAWSLLAASDMLCLSSRHEGLPVVLMEAMTIGLPIVATRAGGIPEAVRDDREGILVEVGDTDALAMSILALAADQDRRVALGAAARERSQIFDVQRSTREIEEVYRQLARSRRREGARRGVRGR